MIKISLQLINAFIDQCRFPGTMTPFLDKMDCAYAFFTGPDFNPAKR
jgi:hypothetical protein